MHIILLLFYHVWNEYSTGNFLHNEKHWMWNCLGMWQSWLDKMCTWKKTAFIVFHQVRTCFYKHTKALKLTLHVQIHNGNQNLSLLQHSLCSAFEPLCADLANAGEHILLVTCMTWTCTRSRTHYVVPETHAYKFSSEIQQKSADLTYIWLWTLIIKLIWTHFAINGDWRLVLFSLPDSKERQIFDIFLLGHHPGFTRTVGKTKHHLTDSSLKKLAL